MRRRGEPRADGKRGTGFSTVMELPNVSVHARDAANRLALADETSQSGSKGMDLAVRRLAAAQRNVRS